MARLDCKKIRNLRSNSVKKNGDLLLTNDLAKTLELSPKPDKSPSSLTAESSYREKG